MYLVQIHALEKPMFTIIFEYNEAALNIKQAKMDGVERE